MSVHDLIRTRLGYAKPPRNARYQDAERGNRERATILRCLAGHFTPVTASELAPKVGLSCKATSEHMLALGREGLLVIMREEKPKSDSSYQVHPVIFDALAESRL